MLKINPSDCANLARSITEYYPKILPATEVISEAQRLARGWLEIRELGVSQKGHSIKLMSSPNDARPNVLLYGFADPGEAVGATGLLCLMKALKDNHRFLSGLPFAWNFIPCLNLDDQPDEGRSLGKLMKTDQQEVDWLVQNPRPETTALLSASESLKPAFTFPLHDEWHCREPLPCYMPVSASLSSEVCDGLKEILTAFGLEISSEVTDPEMGQGFLNMQTVGDFKQSTFCDFSKHGLVFICEVPDLPSRSDKDVIAAQLSAGIFALANCQQRSDTK